MIWCWAAALAGELILSYARAAGDDDDDDDDDAAPVKLLKTKKKSSSSSSSSSADGKSGGDASADTSTSDSAAAANVWYTDDEAGYVWFFVLLTALFIYLAHRRYKRQQQPGGGKRGVLRGGGVLPSRAQLVFLLPYALCVSADWLQGPYAFKLFMFYGLSKSEIGSLFVAGFLSSLVLGTLLSGLADTSVFLLGGRKKACLLYCVLQCAACASKHSKEFPHLLAGRVVGGAATALLHSAFEAHLVGSTSTSTDDAALLPDTLAWMSTVRALGAILAACASGVLLVPQYGFVAPFDLSAALLLVGFALIALMWRENYAAQQQQQGMVHVFSRALGVLGANQKVWLLGFIQACFEGAVYIFVFCWAPILEQTGGGGDNSTAPPPHTLVFCTLMLGVMLGAYNAGAVTAADDQQQHQVATGGAQASLTVIVLALCTQMVPYRLVYLACVAFEVMAGVYYASVAAQRARHVPGDVRATLMGLFRIPLNVLVVLILLNAQDLGTLKLMWAAWALVGLAWAGQRTLAWMVSPLGSGKASDVEDAASAAAAAGKD